MLGQTELLEVVMLLDTTIGVSKQFRAVCPESKKCRATEMHSMLKLYENPILVTEHWDHNLLYRLLQHTIYTVCFRQNEKKSVYLNCLSVTHKNIAYFKIKEEVKLMPLLMHITYSDRVQMAKSVSFVTTIMEEWVPQSASFFRIAGTQETMLVFAIQ